MVKSKSSPMSGIFFKGSIIGAMITIPSLLAFFIAWTITGDKIASLILGIVIHFIGMGFSLKISKKLFKVKSSE